MLPLFEFGFFVPFAIIDHTNGVNFAKNIVNFGIEEVTKQCAKYVGSDAEVFKGTLPQKIAAGYAGPFLICNEDVWSELKSFSKQTGQIWLNEHVSEKNILRNWCIKMIDCFSWTLIVKRENKAAKHVPPQSSEDEETLNAEPFLSWNQNEWLNHSAIDVVKQYTESKCELPSLRTNLSNLIPYSSVFPSITKPIWSQLPKYVVKHKKPIRKQMTKKYCTLSAVNLNHITKEICIKETRKRKLCTTFAANKVSKVSETTLESECSDSDYRSDCEYDEELIHKVLKYFQQQQRRSYHVDPHGISPSVVEATRNYVSSATDSDCNNNHNHNYNVRESVVTESDVVWEKNYIYRTSQQQKRICVDWQDYSLK